MYFSYHNSILSSCISALKYRNEYTVAVQIAYKTRHWIKQTITSSERQCHSQSTLKRIQIKSIWMNMKKRSSFSLSHIVLHTIIIKKINHTIKIFSVQLTEGFLSFYCICAQPLSIQMPLLWEKNLNILFFFFLFWEQ